MEQNPHENQQQEQLEEYFDFVKKSVDDGSYFKDALDWYMLRYVNPVVDRTFMAIVSIFAAVSLYFLVQIISNTFPLVEEVPVVIRDYDASVYRPVISELRDPKDQSIKNVDEAVAKYLLSIYVDDRESFDFRASEVSDVNIKFNRIKNNSSYSEYKNFQNFMSRDNASSPINNFGRNIYRTTKIESVDFLRNSPKNQYEKLKWLFGSKIPTEVEIKFKTETHSFDENSVEKIESENYLAKMQFSFAGLDREAKSGVLNFVVNEYKLYKIK